LNSAIKVALIHHHPVLVPPLAEADRNYDAVERSGQLLSILHEFGFHLLLHGHKHLPLTFSDDMRNAFEITKDHPMMIVAGGSAGSKGLPESGVNTYNLITLKWHAEAGQTRIRVTTRGLVTRNSSKKRMLTHYWSWNTLRTDDRSFVLNDKLTSPKWEKVEIVPFAAANVDDTKRKAQYADLRGNMPVVEVRPSLIPGQAYEATFWIVAHDANHRSYKVPDKVEWSAGGQFSVLTIDRKEDPRFCASFNYWGPMLIQARLFFGKSPPVETFIYARIPGCDSSG
jgi:hypothetical protein